MELTNNIWSIADGLILLKDGTVLSVFEVESQIVNTIEDNKKETSKDLVYNCLASLYEYNDVSIHSLHIDLELAKKISLLAQDIEQGQGTSPLGNYVISTMKSRLEEEVSYIFEYKHYLVVPLKSVNVTSDFKLTVEQTIATYRKNILKMAGFEEMPKIDWWKTWQNQKDMIQTKLHALNVKEVVKADLELLNRLHFLGGQFYDKESELIALENSIENVDETIIEVVDGNALKLTNGQETSYVATIPIVSYPKNVSYLHLQEELQNLEFPVDSVYKIRFSTQRGFFSLFSRARILAIR